MRFFVLVFFLGILGDTTAAKASSAASVERTKQWLKGSNQIKEKRRAALVKKILKDPVPDSFHPDQDSPVKHNKNTPYAIFTIGMSVNFMKSLAVMFSKTARDTGFDGDIVVGVTPGSRDGFKKTLRATDCVMYTPSFPCTSHTYKQAKTPCAPLV